MTKSQILEKIPFKLLAVFLLLAAGISAGGYFYYLKQKIRAVEQIQAELKTIAQFKSEEIAAWRRERYGNAYVLSKSKIFAAYVRRWFGRPKDDELKQNIYERLNAFRIYDPYKEVILVDLTGRVRLFLGQGETEYVSQATKALLNQSLGNNKVLFSDFYYCEKCREVHLDLISPLSDGQGPVGSLILRINPGKYLYLLIQSWPLPSKTGETLLLRREGDEIVYLNDLRHRKDTALKLRLPLTDTLLPAAMAALGKEGTVEGRDYRGVPVAAYIRHIPDSPWFMVAKMDKEEIYAPLKRQARNIWVVMVLAIILLAAVLGFLWQGERRGFYKRQYQQELEKRALIRHYDYLTMYANDIILLSDEKYNLIEVNDRAVEAYGYSREELLKMNASALRADETRPQFKGQIAEMVSKGGMVYETVHKRRDGSTFPVESSARPIEIEGKTYLQGIVRDISERKQYELKIRDRSEELEASNEELMASEEELRAADEELRKQNEELTASEEELQQQNEELQRAQDEITRHTRSMEILHQCSLELASMPAGMPVTDLLTEWLKKLSGGFAVTFGEYDRNNKEIVLKRILLEPGALAKIEEAVGKRLLDLRSPVSPGMYREMMTEEVGVRHSLHDISFGAVPKLASDTLGAMLGLDRFLAIPYQTEGILYGTSVIAFKKGQPEPDQTALKAFGALGAVSLRRALSDEKLQTAHEQLQAGYQEIEANNEELQAAEEEMRKQNEELASSEERLRTILDTTPFPVAVVDFQDNNIEFWSRSARHLFGHTAPTTPEWYQLAYPDPDYRREVIERWKPALEKAKLSGQVVNTGEYRVACYDGSVRLCELYATFQTGKLIVTFNDITERRQAEEKIKENASLLRIAGDKAKLGGWSVDLKNNHCTWSDETAAIHERPAGYAPLVEEGISYYAPEWREKIAKVFTDCAQSGVPYDEEMEIITATGKRVWVRTMGEPVKDEAGKIIKVQGAFQNITERKQAEQKLFKSEKYLRESQQIAHLGHWYLNAATNQVVWSEELYKMYGFDPLLPPPPYTEHMKLFTSESWEMLSTALAITRETGVAYELELTTVRKDGSNGWMWVRGEAEVDPEGKITGLWGAAQDITERKLTEQKITSQLAELKRWQATMLDREDRVMELKREVNEILARQGQPQKYGGG